MTDRAPRPEGMSHKQLTTLKRRVRQYRRAASDAAWGVKPDGTFNPTFANHYELGRSHALAEVLCWLSEKGGRR